MSSLSARHSINKLDPLPCPSKISNTGPTYSCPCSFVTPSFNILLSSEIAPCDIKYSLILSITSSDGISKKNGFWFKKLTTNPRKPLNLPLHSRKAMLVDMQFRKVDRPEVYAARSLVYLEREQAKGERDLLNLAITRRKEYAWIYSHEDSLWYHIGLPTKEEGSLEILGCDFSQLGTTLTLYHTHPGAFQEPRYRYVLDIAKGIKEEISETDRVLLRIFSVFMHVIPSPADIKEFARTYNQCSSDIDFKIISHYGLTSLDFEEKVPRPKRFAESYDKKIHKFIGSNSGLINRPLEEHGQEYVGPVLEILLGQGSGSNLFIECLAESEDIGRIDYDFLIFLKQAQHTIFLKIHCLSNIKIYGLAYFVETYQSQLLKKTERYYQTQDKFFLIQLFLFDHQLT